MQNCVSPSESLPELPLLYLIPQSRLSAEALPLYAI